MLKAEFHRRTSKRRRRPPDLRLHWTQPFPARPLLMGRQGPRAVGSLVQAHPPQFVTAVLRLSPDPLSWHCQSSPEAPSFPTWMSTSQSLNGDLRLHVGEVWLFLRVLIRKLPGSHFYLSFILLLGCVCGPGTS